MPLIQSCYFFCEKFLIVQVGRYHIINIVWSSNFTYPESVWIERDKYMKVCSYPWRGLKMTWIIIRVYFFLNYFQLPQLISSITMPLINISVDITPGIRYIILDIWAFKLKRFPDGRINKHKAQICAHGGMQEYGVNYWETYSPTVNWISVRFLMIFAQVLELDTQAIDSSQSYLRPSWRSLFIWSCQKVWILRVMEKIVQST